MIHCVVGWQLLLGRVRWRGRPPRDRSVCSPGAHEQPDSRAASALILVTRLWPLLIGTLVSCVLRIVRAADSRHCAGFTIVSALAWRNQYAAVLAIEGRDGVRFYVDRKPFLAARSA